MERGGDRWVRICCFKLTAVVREGLSMERGRSGMDAVKRIMTLIADGDGDGERSCSMVVVFL